MNSPAPVLAEVTLSSRAGYWPKQTCLYYAFKIQFRFLNNNTHHCHTMPISVTTETFDYCIVFDFVFKYDHAVILYAIDLPFYSIIVFLGGICFEAAFLLQVYCHALLCNGGTTPMPFSNIFFNIMGFCSLESQISFTDALKDYYYPRPKFPWRFYSPPYHSWLEPNLSLFV